MEIQLPLNLIGSFGHHRLQVGLLAEIRAYEKTRKQRRLAHRQRDQVMADEQEEEEEEEEGEIDDKVEADRPHHASDAPRGKQHSGQGAGEKVQGRGVGRGGQLPRGEQYSVASTQPLCRHWRVGRCTRGDDCGYSHDCTPITKLHIPCK